MARPDATGAPAGGVRGVTSIHDKDGWLGALRRFQALRREDALPLRVWQSLPAAKLDEIAEVGLASGLGDDYLRVGYIKAFMDGTLGSETARLLDGSGVEITSREELETSSAGPPPPAFPWPCTRSATWPTATPSTPSRRPATCGRRRASGPASSTPSSSPGRTSRASPRIGVAASVQFTHATSDRDLADRIWAGFEERAYAYRSLWDAGALVANGSDAPVEELDPLAGLRAGVLRTQDDRPAWHPEQALTVEEALQATTVNPAWLTGDERRRGKLVPGYLADLVVLDRDPLSCEPEELRELSVVATMCGGRWTHNPPPWD